jgi:hypothetical protein
VTASDSGIATSEITVVRTDSRKANSTIATMIAPSRSASATLPIEALMKSAWRNSTRGSARPAGQALLQLGERRLDLRGELDGVGIGLLLDADHDGRQAVVARVAALQARREGHVATCSSRMARPSFQATAMPARSSTRLLRPRWRIRYSRLFRSMKPPPALPA